MLVCPKTRKPLRLADDATLKALNAAITEGKLRNQKGVPVQQTLDAALVREGDDLAYPIYDDIPQLIVEDGIALDQLA